MKSIFYAGTVALLAAGAFAQSSGNFSAFGTSAACVINGTTGALSGGTTIGTFTADISTGSGNGTTLDIRPALVTGLFTDTKISTTVPTATADVGIQVCVTVDGSGAAVLPASCVTYDQRFQEISSQLFSTLTKCTAAPTGTACSTNSQACGTGNTCQLGTSGTCTATGAACVSNTQCSAVTAGDTCNFSGQCVGPNPLCNFTLILSTLSAHSFDFVVPVDNKKPHVVSATWSVIGQTSNNGNSSVASCVGPGILTVTQTKVFNNSGSLSFTSN